MEGLYSTTRPEACCACRPVSDPFGYLLGAGPPVETGESKRAWGELVKALRVRGPASKSDPSLAAGLMRLTGAGGERFPPSWRTHTTANIGAPQLPSHQHLLCLGSTHPSQ